MSPTITGQSHLSCPQKVRISFFSLSSLWWLKPQLILSTHLSSIRKEVRKLWKKNVVDVLSAKWLHCLSSRWIRSQTDKSCIQVFTCSAAAVPLVSGVYTVLKELFTMHRGLWSSWKLYCFFALAYRLNILHKQSHVNPLNISCPQASRGVNVLLWRTIFPGEEERIWIFTLYTTDFVLKGHVTSRIH